VIRRWCIALLLLSAASCSPDRPEPDSDDSNDQPSTRINDALSGDGDNAHAATPNNSARPASDAENSDTNNDTVNAGNPAVQPTPQAFPSAQEVRAEVARLAADAGADFVDGRTFVDTLQDALTSWIAELAASHAGDRACQRRIVEVIEPSVSSALAALEEGWRALRAFDRDLDASTGERVFLAKFERAFFSSVMNHRAVFNDW